MFTRGRFFLTGALACGLVLGGLGLPRAGFGPTPARATSSLKKLEKKLRKARKKSEKALEETGKVVMAGVFDVGLILLALAASDDEETVIELDFRGFDWRHWRSARPEISPGPKALAVPRHPEPVHAPPPPAKPTPPPPPRQKQPPPK